MATTRRLIGNIKGPKGDTGATGATGAQGPAGQDGAPGVNDYATTEAAGLVRVGTDLKIDGNNGTLSIKNAFTKASTLAKMVSEEAFATSLGKIAKAVDWVVDNAPNFFNKNADIVDGFDSSLANKALSANAGKTLKTQLDSLSGSITTLNNLFIRKNDVTTGNIGGVSFSILLRKNGKTVTVMATIENTNLATTSGVEEIATIPEGYRPTNTILFLATGRDQGGWAVANYSYPVMSINASDGLVIMRLKQELFKTVRYITFSTSYVCD